MSVQRCVDPEMCIILISSLRFVHALVVFGIITRRKMCLETTTLRFNVIWCRSYMDVVISGLLDCAVLEKYIYDILLDIDKRLSCSKCNTTSGFHKSVAL